jgi:hypothetical protein
MPNWHHPFEMNVMSNCRDYLVIQIVWSKTIQSGDRKLEIPLVKIPNSPLCPYQAYTVMPYEANADFLVLNHDIII